MIIMRKRRSGFWTFIFSWIPGCAEMYWGFMKQGISLLGAFCAVAFVATILNIGPMMFLDLIVWCYAFFHAINMVHLSDEELQNIQDDYLYHFDSLKGLQKNNIRNNKVLAIVLIVGGAILVLRGFYEMLAPYMPDEIWNMIGSIFGYVPQILVGIAIVAVGMMMIWGKKQDLLEEHKDGQNE